MSLCHFDGLQVLLSVCGAGCDSVSVIALHGKVQLVTEQQLGFNPPLHGKDQRMYRFARLCLLTWGSERCDAVRFGVVVGVCLTLQAFLLYL